MINEAISAKKPSNHQSVINEVNRLSVIAESLESLLTALREGPVECPSNPTSAETAIPFVDFYEYMEDRLENNRSQCVNLIDTIRGILRV